MRVSGKEVKGLSVALPFNDDHTLGHGLTPSLQTILANLVLYVRIVSKDIADQVTAFIPAIMYREEIRWRGCNAKLDAGDWKLLSIAVVGCSRRRYLDHSGWAGNVSGN